MAIIQISKIQARSGDLVDLPQLSEGEFGWASDAGLLYIGKSQANANIENVEVLTSYSNVSFSQIDGAVGNLDISSSVANGQVLTYNGSNWVNRGGTVGGLINLGNVSNVKLSGGAIGYVLETDGTGNLSWTPKGTLYTAIRGLSNANPIVMTVANTTPYTNKQSITITGANATNANTVVNGQVFYVKLATDFPTSGNVTLYSDNALTVPVNGTTLGSYTANSGIATAVISSGSTGANASGSNQSVQFNNSGVLDGSANLTFTGTILNVTGNANVTGNVNTTGTVTASRLISNVATGTAPFTVTSTTQVANLNVATAGVAGTVTTAAQPNITSVGTLTSVSVSGNANIGNIGTAGLITATGNITGGNLITGGVVSATGNVSGGNLVTGGALSVTGNANIGNIGTAGLITATGNITGGNLVTGGALSVTGNANIGNIGTGGAITATGNILTNSILNANYNPVTTTGQALALRGSNTQGGTGFFDGISFTNLSGGATNPSKFIRINSTGSLQVVNSLYTASLFDLSDAGVLSISGNISGANIITAGIVSATGNGTFGNVNATLFVGNLSGTGNSNVGNLGASGIFATTLSATGNANVGNIGATNGVFTNVSGNGSSLSSLTGANVSGQVSFAATANSVAGANVSGQVANALVAGTVYTAAQPNITSVSTSFTNLTFANAQTITGNNITISAGANTNSGTFTGNWTLSAGSRLQATYADLAEYYEADTDYAPGTVLQFGGEKEVTIAEDSTNRVAGVVSTNPAYAMNSLCPGIAVAIALQGRVPVKVRGKIAKGDMMISGGNGYARPCSTPIIGSVIGKALENFDGVEGVIEIAVGRL